MPLSVRDAIDTDTGEKIKLKRKTQGFFEKGIWQEGRFTYIKALASVQQPTKQQIELFTGLERDKDMKTFYINKFVQASSEFDDKEADTIIWKDREYRAMHVGEWESYGYNIILGVRIK